MSGRPLRQVSAHGGQPYGTGLGRAQVSAQSTFGVVPVAVSAGQLKHGSAAGAVGKAAAGCAASFTGFDTSRLAEAEFVLVFGRSSRANC